MKISFPYEKEHSKIFGEIRRPVSVVSFWSNKFSRYISISLIVDTGADYTLLPFSKAEDLGINLKSECKIFNTLGIGGVEKVYLFPKLKMKLGEKEIFIPVGFLRRDDIPPLLGRYKCLDNFSVLFSSFNVSFQ